MSKSIAREPGPEPETAKVIKAEQTGEKVAEKSDERSTALKAKDSNLTQNKGKAEKAAKKPRNIKKVA